MDKKDIYDVIIIGGGPAGLSAGIYCARYNLKTLLIYESIGGAMATAHNIGNYPGFENISGVELSEKMKIQAEKLGVCFVSDIVKKLEKTKLGFNVSCLDKIFEAKKLIFCLGTKQRKLGIEDEDKFIGRGISYCTTCDASFFRDKIVTVAGGGDAAFDAALLLSDIAKKVYLIHRREGFRTEPFKVHKAEKKENVEFMLNRTIEKAKGNQSLESIIVKNVKSGGSEEIKTDGLFIEIGATPMTVLVSELGVILENNLIKVDERQETNVKGVFAAGDITTASSGFRQIVTAVSEGAVATYNIYTDLTG